MTRYIRKKIFHLTIASLMILNLSCDSEEAALILDPSSYNYILEVSDNINDGDVFYADYDISNDPTFEVTLLKTVNNTTYLPADNKNVKFEWTIANSSNCSLCSNPQLVITDTTSQIINSGDTFSTNSEGKISFYWQDNGKTGDVILNIISTDDNTLNTSIPFNLRSQNDKVHSIQSLPNEIVDLNGILETSGNFEVKALNESNGIIPKVEIHISNIQGTCGDNANLSFISDVALTDINGKAEFNYDITNQNLIENCTIEYTASATDYNNNTVNSTGQLQLNIQGQEFFEIDLTEVNFLNLDMLPEVFVFNDDPSLTPDSSFVDELTIEAIVRDASTVALPNIPVSFTNLTPQYGTLLAGVVNTNSEGIASNKLIDIDTDELTGSTDQIQITASIKGSDGQNIDECDLDGNGTANEACTRTATTQIIAQSLSNISQVFDLDADYISDSNLIYDSFDDFNDHIRAQVKGEFNEPVEGVKVNFNLITDDIGYITTAYAYSDANGFANVTYKINPEDLSDAGSNYAPTELVVTIPNSETCYYNPGVWQLLDVNNDQVIDEDDFGVGQCIIGGQIVGDAAVNNEEACLSEDTVFSTWDKNTDSCVAPRYSLDVYKKLLSRIYYLEPAPQITDFQLDLTPDTLTYNDIPSSGGDSTTVFLDEVTIEAIVKDEDGVAIPSIPVNFSNQTLTYGTLLYSIVNTNSSGVAANTLADIDIPDNILGCDNDAYDNEADCIAADNDNDGIADGVWKNGIDNIILRAEIYSDQNGLPTLETYDTAEAMVVPQSIYNIWKVYNWDYSFKEQINYIYESNYSFSDSVEVQVLDNKGTPVKDVPIQFSLVNANGDAYEGDVGYISSEVEYSDDNGKASVAYNITSADLSDIGVNEAFCSEGNFTTQSECCIADGGTLNNETNTCEGGNDLIVWTPESPITHQTVYISAHINDTFNGILSRTYTIVPLPSLGRIDLDMDPDTLIFSDITNDTTNTTYETINLYALVENSDGAVMENIPVSFNSSTPYGSLLNSTVLTDSSGIASNQIINIDEEQFNFTNGEYDSINVSITVLAGDETYTDSDKSVLIPESLKQLWKVTHMDTWWDQDLLNNDSTFFNVDTQFQDAINVQVFDKFSTPVENVPIRFNLDNWACYGEILGENESPSSTQADCCAADNGTWNQITNNCDNADGTVNWLSFGFLTLEESITDSTGTVQTIFSINQSDLDTFASYEAAFVNINITAGYELSPSPQHIETLTRTYITDGYSNIEYSVSNFRYVEGGNVNYSSICSYPLFLNQSECVAHGTCTTAAFCSDDSYDNEDTCTSNDGQWNAESSVSLLVENENQCNEIWTLNTWSPTIAELQFYEISNEPVSFDFCFEAIDNQGVSICGVPIDFELTKPSNSGVFNGMLSATRRYTGPPNTNGDVDNDTGGTDNTAGSDDFNTAATACAAADPEGPFEACVKYTFTPSDENFSSSIYDPDNIVAHIIDPNIQTNNVQCNLPSGLGDCEHNLPIAMRGPQENTQTPVSISSYAIPSTISMTVLDSIYCDTLYSVVQNIYNEPLANIPVQFNIDENDSDFGVLTPSFAQTDSISYPPYIAATTLYCTLPNTVLSYCDNNSYADIASCQENGANWINEFDINITSTVAGSDPEISSNLVLPITEDLPNCPECEPEIAIASDYSTLPATDYNNTIWLDNDPDLGTGCYNSETESMTGATEEECANDDLQIFSATLTATVVDSTLNAVPNTLVEWIAEIDSADVFIPIGNIIENTVTNAIGIATTVFSTANDLGLARITATAPLILDINGEALSAQTYINIVSNEATTIELVAPDVDVISVANTGGNEATEITVNIKDGNGNFVTDNYITFFELGAGAPLGTYLNEPNTSSTCITSANGISEVTINSGNNPGSVPIKVELYPLDTECSDIVSGTAGEPIASILNSPVIIESGPPRFGQINFSYVDITTIGGGLYQLPFSLQLEDKWTNPVPDSVAVWFKIEGHKPTWCSAADVFTNPDLDNEDCTYAVGDTVKYALPTQSIADSLLFVLDEAIPDNVPQPVTLATWTPLGDLGSDHWRNVDHPGTVDGFSETGEPDPINDVSTAGLAWSEARFSTAEMFESVAIKAWTFGRNSAPYCNDGISDDENDCLAAGAEWIPIGQDSLIYIDSRASHQGEPMILPADPNATVTVGIDTPMPYDFTFNGDENCGGPCGEPDCLNEAGEDFVDITITGGITDYYQYSVDGARLQALAPSAEFLAVCDPADTDNDGFTGCCNALDEDNDGVCDDPDTTDGSEFTTCTQCQANGFVWNLDDGTHGPNANTDDFTVGISNPDGQVLWLVRYIESVVPLEGTCPEAADETATYGNFQRNILVNLLDPIQTTSNPPAELNLEKTEVEEVD